MADLARQNAGYLYAIRHGAQVVYETDDDNELLGNLQSFDMSLEPAHMWEFLAPETASRSVCNPCVASLV